MTERGMIFNAEMVRAVLDGRKTQTRRIMTVQPHAGVRSSVFVKSGFEDGHGKELVCPFGAVGDRLWVRETWNKYGGLITYRADHDWMAEMKKETGACPAKWTPSIHMPRWDSRITLEITGVRVERLQDISESDCAAEGLGSPFLRDYKKSKFAALWQSIYGADSWQANPWVWVIEFKRVEDGRHE